MQNELQIMSSKGHSSVKWNPAEPGEVAIAEAAFDTCMDKGFSAFRVKKDGERGERITEFDPEAKEIIMIPPIKGG